MQEKTSEQALKDAKDLLKENKSLESVKQSAKILELNPEEASIEKEDGDLDLKKKEEGLKENPKSSPIIPKMQLGNNQFLNQMKLANEMQNQLEKTVSDDFYNKQSPYKTEELKGQTPPQNLSNTQDTQKNTPASIIPMQVPQDVIETIESKIIGAKQKVSTFMSDVARNVYLNYKPPVTAFRIRLNPGNLGNIDVVMRSSKADNSLNISMNMNNSNTLDLFSENKQTLQNALNRQMGDNANISLGFSMQNDTSSQGGFSGGQDNQGNNSGFNSFQGDEGANDSEPADSVDSDEQAYM
jgi:hypothetical protein